MSESENYWERTEFPFMDYPDGITQDEGMGCVVSSIAGAINYLTHETVWDETRLIDACGRNDRRQWQGPNVIDVAMQDTRARSKLNGRFIDKTPNSEFPNRVRQLIDEGAIVILSRQSLNSFGIQSGYHMLTLLKRDGDRYQVWDTSGVRGCIRECELCKTIPKYNVGFLGPHEDNHFFMISKQ